jgi:hypothetical protein
MKKLVFWLMLLLLVYLFFGGDINLGSSNLVDSATKVLGSSGKSVSGGVNTASIFDPMLDKAGTFLTKWLDDLSCFFGNCHTTTTDAPVTKKQKAKQKKKQKKVSN